MLKTEMRNEHTMHIDKMTSAEMVAAMARENYRAAAAVEEQSDAIAKGVDLIAEAFNSGHRLFFVGCGTSGRLGVLDAVECPPTFGVSTGLKHKTYRLRNCHKISDNIRMSDCDWATLFDLFFKQWNY